MTALRPARFLRREEGSLTVEFVLVLPLLLWALVALHVFVGAFELRNTATKATYTLADMLSRQTRPVDQPFLDSADAVLRFLAGPTARLRVTVIRCSAACEADSTRELALDWSGASEGMQALTVSDIARSGFRGRIPAMELGDRMIVVETEVDYAPIAGYGLPGMTFDTLMATPPRFAPQLCWQSCG
ncbi:TadE/TadG family type IV pilus assembly protein [Rhodovulum sulfidophilum]|uniref:TadE/TadG family type IV pilus assembly protein n=1 Tax=Rhodovulum sulfidophilum TaxID=35806 RepID=UPI00138A16D0|nr:TadE/TadG family type IV pilus assembly protein [Rhodovulum sulfidophilum]NDK35596.1 pilus assembly protein [Rhodovulum sulfidophilum]